MSQYLRDEFLTNLNISKKALDELNAVLINLRDDENRKINNDTKNVKFLSLVYTIRFDNNGFKLYDYNQVMEHFNSAKEVERFVFELQALEHTTSNKLKGKSVALWFDKKVLSNCVLMVQDDQQVWSDSSFLKLKEVLNKYDNKNKFIRSSFSVLSVQILGALAGVLLGLWVATKASTKLNIPNPYSTIFIITLLIYSNIWSHLYGFILRRIDSFWPNISFKELTTWRKFINNLMFGLFVTFCGLILVGIIDKLWGFVRSLWR
jgi:hypothetical protein